MSNELIKGKALGNGKALGQREVLGSERLRVKVVVNSCLQCQLSDLGQVFKVSELWFPHQRIGYQNPCPRRLLGQLAIPCLRA